MRHNPTPAPYLSHAKPDKRRHVSLRILDLFVLAVLVMVAWAVVVLVRAA